MSWPTVPGPPIRLPESTTQHEGLWTTLIELCGVGSGRWTLIGGQMVLLHALEQGVTPPRVSLDLDLLVNARIATGAIPRFAAAITAREFELDGVDPFGVGHRFTREGVSVDILAPEGLGSRADLTTTPPARTVEVPGGTQALQRTELVTVAAGRLEGTVPRPSLLGALVIKAAAVEVDDLPDAQRQDLVFLLGLVADPVAMQEEMTSTDRRRLRHRREMQDADHPAWRTLSAADRRRAFAALSLLTSSHSR